MQFIQGTYVRDKCIVEVFPSKHTEGKDKYHFHQLSILVHIDKIFPYDKDKLSEEHRKMFDEEKEQKLRKKPERKEFELKRSLELCEIVETMYMNYAIKKPFQLPVFKVEGGIPLKEADLQLYFKRRTTQIMSFLIDHIDFSKAQEVKKQMREWKSQIVKETIRNVTECKMNLILN